MSLNFINTMNYDLNYTKETPLYIYQSSQLLRCEPSALISTFTYSILKFINLKYNKSSSSTTILKFGKTELEDFLLKIANEPLSQLHNIYSELEKLTINLHKKARYLFELDSSNQDNIVKINLNELLSLKSLYSVGMYEISMLELSKDSSNKQAKFYLNSDKLKRMLGIPEEQYSNIEDLEKNILNLVCIDLEKLNLNLNFSFSKHNKISFSVSL